MKNYPIKYEIDEYIDAIHFFITEYQEAPFRMIFEDVFCEKLFKRWKKKYELNIYTEVINNKEKRIGKTIVTLADGVVGVIPRDYSNDNDIQILYKKNIKKTVLKPFIKEIKTFFKAKKSSQNKIEILFNDGNYSEFKSFDVKNIKIDITKNYNEDFLPIHKIILKNLTKKEANGLIILYGDPGTGKTHYLRYLSAILKKKKLFIPSNMAGSLANPDFISKLEENKGSLLIIEDADEILSRKGDGNTAVSNLLNLSDGLLADVLNIQIICTFNSPLTVIDEALLRKGRVIAKYEFKALNTKKAQALSNELGFNRKINKPTKLSNLYNYSDESFTDTKKTIGF